MYRSVTIELCQIHAMYLAQPQKAQAWLAYAERSEIAAASGGSFEVRSPGPAEAKTRPRCPRKEQKGRKPKCSLLAMLPAVGWKGCTPANANLASQACCTKTEKAGSKAHVFWSATQIRTLSKTSGIQEPRALRKATYGCTESTT